MENEFPPISHEWHYRIRAEICHLLVGWAGVRVGG